MVALPFWLTTANAEFQANGWGSNMRTQANLPAAGMISELAGHTYFQIITDPTTLPANKLHIYFNGTDTIYDPIYPDHAPRVLCHGRPYIRLRLIDGNGGTHINNYTGDWSLVPTTPIYIGFALFYNNLIIMDLSSKPGGAGVVKTFNLRKP